MTTTRRRFTKGINLDPDTTSLTNEGDVKFDDTSKKLQYQDDVGTKSVVSEDGTQTLENKTIDATSATGNNTLSADSNDIVYDNSTSGLTATNVKDALDEVQANIEGQDEASEISYDNSTSGLSATNTQDAIDEVDSNLDTHIADTAAHGVTGAVVGTTNTQTLTNKTIDADSNTISNIDNNDIKTLAGIDATKIADGSVTNTEYQYIGGLTSDAQTQIDNKLSGIGASNDNRIIRNDGTTGNSFQESLVSIDDIGAMSGVTQLDVDNIRVDGNTLSSTDTNGNVEISPDGTGITKVNSDHQVTGNVIRDVSTDTATGSNVTLSTPTTKNIRLTDGSLSSIDMIPAGTDGQEIVLINATGAQISINDSTGATAANQIKTGTQAAIQLSDEASIPLVYDATEAKWMVSAGVGGSDSVSDPSIYAIYNAEDQDVTSFTNISSTTSSPINGTTSYSVDSYTASLPTITLNERNKGKENNVELHYTMTSGTAKLVVKDNASNILAEQEITASVTPKVVNLLYFVNTSVTNIQLSIEDVSSATGLKLDDIIFTDNQVKYNSTIDEQTYRITQNGDAMSNGNNEWQFDLNTATIINNGSDIIYAEDDSSNTRTKFIAKRDCNVTVSAAASEDSAFQIGIAINDSVVKSGNNASANEVRIVTAIITLSAGDYFTVGNTNELSFNGDLRNAAVPVVMDFHAIASSEVVITPSRSDTLSYRAYTATGFGSTANKIPYFTNEDFRKESAIGTISNDSINGWSYTANVAQNIIINFSFFSDSGNQAGISLNSSELTTGILSIDAESRLAMGWADGTDDNTAGHASVTWSGRLEVGDVIRPHTNGVNNSSYNDANLISILAHNANASFFSAVPVQRTVYIKDVKATGANGQGINASTETTRDLNTVEGDSSIVVLSSNQFTLNAGTYEIEGRVPGYNIAEQRSYLYNVSDSSVEIYGDVGYSSGTQSYSEFKGRLVLTSSKTFEVRQYCALTNGTNGGGVAYTGPGGSSSVFTTVKVTKIK